MEVESEGVPLGAPRSGIVGCRSPSRFCGHAAKGSSVATAVPCPLPSPVELRAERRPPYSVLRGTGGRGGGRASPWGLGSRHSQASSPPPPTRASSSEAGVSPFLHVVAESISVEPSESSLFPLICLPRDLVYCAQAHPDDRGQRWDLNPGPCDDTK